MDEGFQERQKELCLLSSFISEQEQWLESLLEKLNWSQDRLHTPRENPLLVRCPYNEHHYVSSTSLEVHKAKCVYATMGIDTQIIEDSGPLVVDKDSLYRNSGVSEVKIDTAIERAVAICAKDPELSYKNEQSHGASVTHQDNYSSLEDSQTPSLDAKKLKPHQIVSYIKSWQRVPADWASVTLASPDLVRVKGWLFNHLPTGHAHSTSVGGEITAVNSILGYLTFLPGQPVETSISPNVLVEKLTPLLRSKTREFVFNLWKFIHISQLQTRCGISDSGVDDIASMPRSQLIVLGGASFTEKQRVPVILHKIQHLTQQELATTSSSTSSQPLPLPMDTVFYTRTPTERRLMYDYIIEASQSVVPKERLHDPDLYRDDVAALKAKLKAQAQQEQSGSSQDTKCFEEVLKDRKEKRDYKRRRQKYRAKNVHITRRKTSEIFRDIINNRMEEIKESISSQDYPYISNPEVDTELKQHLQHTGSDVVHDRDKKQTESIRHQEISTILGSPQDQKVSSTSLGSQPPTEEVCETVTERKDDVRRNSKRRKHHHRSRSHSRDRPHKKHKTHHKSHSRKHSK